MTDEKVRRGCGANFILAQASDFTIPRLRREAFVTEAELKKHLDAAEESPRQIAAAVLGLPEKTLRYKFSPDKWAFGRFLDISPIWKSCTPTDFGRCSPTKTR
jgi:hypothetical protein